MNKTQLIDFIAEKADLTKVQAKAALEATLGAVEGALKDGDQVQLIGFGTFKVNHRSAVLAVIQRPVKRSKLRQLTFLHS